MKIPTSTPKRRLTGVLALVAVAGIAPAAVAMGATGFADPSATTTTTTTTTEVPSDIAVVTPTTTTRPRDGSAPDPSPPPTTPAPAPPTAPPSRPPSVPPVIAQAPTTTTTEPVDEVAVVPIPPGEPGQLATGATVPVGGDDPVPVGEWSSDPDDWTPAVRAYLTSQGVDIGDLSASVQAAGEADIGGFQVEPSCAVNCITSGLAHAVGVGVYLEVTTSVPAFIQIEIVDVGLKFGPPSAMKWGATWAHLEPGTTYDAIARAHDAQGNMSVASGSFTTLTRSAQITFTPTVFWFGNDPTFNPWGEHQWQLEARAFLDGDELASATGATAPAAAIQATASALGLTIETGEAADSVVDVAYSGAYRCVGGCPWDGQAVAHPLDGPNGGSFGFWWGTVANGIQLDGYPDDVTSWTGHQFTFPLSTFHGEPVGPAVYLATDVTVEVSYIPAG